MDKIYFSVIITCDDNLTGLRLVLLQPLNLFSSQKKVGIRLSVRAQNPEANNDLNRLSQIFVRLFVALLMSYLALLGATPSGLLHPEIGLLTMILIAVMVCGWLYVHWRQKWQWHATRMDGVILLWALAFSLSLLTNLEAGRRILIGMWYMGAYIGVWYVLRDTLANRPQLRLVLADSFLIAGMFVLVFGYIQVFAWLTGVVQSGIGIVAIERPGSTFGNPNLLGSFLVMLMPFVLTRLVTARILYQRLVLAVYFLLVVILLLFSFSRGAWIAAGASIVIYGLMRLAAQESLRVRLIEIWSTRRPLLVYGVVLIGLMAFLIFLTIFGGSFGDPIRGADSRTEIYASAIQLFGEKPLAGQGLFTFARGMVRLPDVHPAPHTHAHNIVLHIAAELGLIGLGALAMTVVVVVLDWWRNWKIVGNPDRVFYAGAIAAFIGFAVHLLFDVAAMVPIVMLTGLLTLALGLAPGVPVTTRRRHIYPVVLAILWLILAFTGLWSNGIYTSYRAVVNDSDRTGLYRQGAERLQAVIESDSLSLYRLEQAFLYGMAASEGDLDAARQGIVAYQHFLDLEPGYAFAWANLAALRWQLAERNEAVAAMQEAERLDSDAWQYPANLALYLRALGSEAEAISAYQRALRQNPDARLYTELSKFPTDGSPEMNIPTRVSLLLEEGAVTDAVQLWSQHSLPENVTNDVVQSMLASAQSDFVQARNWLARAGQIAVSRTDLSWVHLGRANQSWVHFGQSKLALAVGETDRAMQELEAARGLLERDVLEVDQISLRDMNQNQFWRLPFQRQFLPQVFYPVDDALLLYLLERSS